MAWLLSHSAKMAALTFADLPSIMLPVLVKNWETSSPRSASRAIFSADAAFPDLRVFFIESQK